MPDLGQVAALAHRIEEGGLGAVEQVLVEAGDVEVQVEGEPVTQPVSVQRLPSAEREPEIGDRVQGVLGNRALERRKRHEPGPGSGGQDRVGGFPEFPHGLGQGQ